MRHLIITLFIATLNSPVLAAEVIPGPFKAVPYSIYDADTFKAHVRVWLGQTVATSIRIGGIDTPEIRGKCPEEKALALKAKTRLEMLLSSGVVELWRVQYGKWAGRVIAHVTVNGESVPDVLINEGLARPYDGGKRQSWCN